MSRRPFCGLAGKQMGLSHVSMILQYMCSIEAAARTRIGAPVSRIVSASFFPSSFFLQSPHRGHPFSSPNSWISKPRCRNYRLMSCPRNARSECETGGHGVQKPEGWRDCSEMTRSEPVVGGKKKEKADLIAQFQGLGFFSFFFFFLSFFQGVACRWSRI